LQDKEGIWMSNLKLVRGYEPNVRTMLQCYNATPVNLFRAQPFGIFAEYIAIKQSFSHSRIQTLK